MEDNVHLAQQYAEKNKLNKFTFKQWDQGYTAWCCTTTVPQNRGEQMMSTIPAFKIASYYTEGKKDHSPLQAHPTGSFLNFFQIRTLFQKEL